mgnify:CR=1 FL=1
MRIDAHAHGDPNNWRGDPQAYIDACHEHGIEAIVLIEPLPRCLAALDRFGEFIIPVARVAMDTCGVEGIEHPIRAGCRGIKFICPRAPYGDERYWPLYERLEQLGAVAVFHTGYLGYLPEQGLESRDHPVSMEHMRAAQVELISRRFPELKILMAHFSNPWWEEAWKVSSSKPNIYADLSGGTAIWRSMRMWTEMFAPDGRLIENSVKKLCFGTDVRYFQEAEPQIEPYISFYERLFDGIGLSRQLREVVLRTNIRRLFGLSPVQ